VGAEREDKVCVEYTREEDDGYGDQRKGEEKRR